MKEDEDVVAPSNVTAPLKSVVAEKVFAPDIVWVVFKYTPFVTVAALPVISEDIVAGNLASAIVPDAILLAFNAVSVVPMP